MTQEDKQLLIKDLSGRLPYEVKLDNGLKLRSIDVLTQIVSCSGSDRKIENVRPYLRPISSMTQSEIDKLFDVLHIDKDGNDEDWIKINDVVGIRFFFPTGKWVENVAEAYDYLNSIHIDYRGLIPIELALEAPEGMYKTK